MTAFSGYIVYIKILAVVNAEIPVLQIICNYYGFPSIISMMIKEKINKEKQIKLL